MTEKDICIMRDQIRHRGPDDAGIDIYYNEKLFVGLGHRRLSIIDLSPRGHQPMTTADGTLSIVFNGEIFNYKELRKTLIATDKYSFCSESDTEVLLYAVREWGLEGCLKRIRGMYAFALFDKLEGALTLVRDPLGVKPLYYYENGLTVTFASEIKALMAMPGVKRRLNNQALYHYLTFANSPSPETVFEGIRKLEAGCYLRTNAAGHREMKRYWDPTQFRPYGEDLSEKEYIDEIRRLLRQSVARRMVSDVPFGVFLSGGLDSTLNVALMAELMDRPVETFSIGIEGDRTNEFAYARSVAKRFGANHHEMVINDEDFISFLPEMPFYQDEPLADPVCVPLYYISRLARESGTPVIQVGEGSDEIFAGYKMYHFFNRIDCSFYRNYLKLPSWIKSSLYKTGKNIFSSEKEDGLRRAVLNEPLFLGNAIAFWDCEKGKLLSNGSGWQTSSAFIKGIKDQVNVNDPLLSIINIELKNRLPELLLMRVDKMSMAHSIETRVPFLDEDLVEFALQIPSTLKFKNGESKYILKKAAEGIIPNEIIYRQKVGFCGSATNMLSKKTNLFARDVIYSSPFLKEICNRKYIDELFRQQEIQKRFNNFKVWNLMNLALWHKCWF